jgi:riboflavin kinase/FMN adenylyltransferase
MLAKNNRNLRFLVSCLVYFIVTCCSWHFILFMRLFNSLTDLPDFKKSVITIGTFDGVHIGHQEIIHRINSLAAAYGGEGILLTFHPHPRTILNTSFQLQLLTTLPERLNLLAQHQLQNAVVVPFTKHFANMLPADFVKKILIKHFHPACIAIGYDHRFGRNRQGDIHLLWQLSGQYGYDVLEISEQQIAKNAISSTRIREALLTRKPHEATQLLGYPYFLSGKVIKGQQLGRKLGYPTANIQPSDPQKLIPADGIYALQLQLNNQRNLLGVGSIGIRPTIGQGLQRTIEVYIFDFDETIYDQTLTLNFIAYLRPEQKFDNLPLMVQQIQHDVATAKQVLSAIKS